MISFASRTLNQCEKNYNVTEKELLSVVFACSKFRTYILGYPVTIRTDHKSISFLRRCKLSHGQLARWVLALQEYNLQWEYIPGKKNVVADVLSRINLEDQTFEGEKESLVKIYNLIKTRSYLEALLVNILIHQQSDPKLKISQTYSRAHARAHTHTLGSYVLNKADLHISGGWLSLIHI